MKNKYVKIEGIHCNHCIDLITKELLKNKNIKEVKIKNNIAHIKYEKKLTNKEIIKIITNIDYITKDEYISDNLKDIESYDPDLLKIIKYTKDNDNINPHLVNPEYLKMTAAEEKKLND